MYMYIVGPTRTRDLVTLGATVTWSWPENQFISVVYVTGQNNIQVKIF